ncbi:MAG TPA: isochorismatase family cysteine hydrolase, partial [Sediminibacterium sp.]|nr:isochorismatase family cysteine hydrolase [Sediminibacterium sp.]
MESTTALLVMDMQAKLLASVPDAQTTIQHMARAIAYARQQQIPVIYVVVGFRDGLPEISSNNKRFSAFRKRLEGMTMQEWMTIHPELAPLENEPVAVKRRISAFAGSDLDILLRAKQITHLVLGGCSTSGVVLSTLREAADKDYRLTVLSDCCMDGDPEVHDLLLRKIFP